MSTRWRWMFAFLPIMPPLSLAFFYFIHSWRRLRGSVRLVFYLYVGSQLVAALLSPDVLLSVSLALLRSLFIVSLVLAGASLREPRLLRYLLLGIAVVFVVAFVTSFRVSGGVFLLRRIMHPYYTTVALGLSAVLALWILLDWKDGSWFVKAPLGLLALAVLALSGSRGAIGAFVVGVSAAAILRDRRYFWGLGSVAGVMALAYATLAYGIRVTAFSRLFSLRLAGRSELWSDAVQAFYSHPWGGVGPYQLGPWLGHFFSSGCHLPKGAVRLGLSCPAWADRLNGAWLIAHNAFLQALAETGLLGMVGYLALLVLIGYAVIRAREPLPAAIYFGFLAMSLVDNPITVPSLHFAEVFWVAGGMALAGAGLAVPLEQRLAVDDDQLGPDPL